MFILPGKIITVYCLSPNLVMPSRVGCLPPSSNIQNLLQAVASRGRRERQEYCTTSEIEILVLNNTGTTISEADGMN
jgi:hypothetical protein